MMKKIEHICNRTYKTKLLKHPYYKEKLVKMRSLLKEYNIKVKPKNDFAYYEVEILYESLNNKLKMEHSFFQTYADMQDYWNDLDYQERKHQVYADSKKVRKYLKYFEHNEQPIYMPIFNEEVNRVYREEILLLDLKKYSYLFKNFTKEIQYHYYGILPYQHGFTSTIFLYGDETCCCLYNADVNRLYKIKNYECVAELSLDPEKSTHINLGNMILLGKYYVENKPIQLIEHLLTLDIVNDKVKRKLEKYGKRSSYLNR